MLTNAADTARADNVAPMTGAQKVVIVNGSPDILDLLETALDAGRMAKANNRLTARVENPTACSGLPFLSERPNESSG